MSTAASMSEIIGCRALLSAQDLTIGVTIRDAKAAYGRTRYLVAPIVGHGEQWVEESRLSDVRRPRT